MNGRERISGAALGVIAALALAACGGGGGTSASPGGSTPPVGTTTVTDSSAAALALDEDPNTIVGDPSHYGTIVGAPGNSTIDGLSCMSSMPGTTHYHVHFSLFVNGHQYAIPAGTGIYEPGVTNPSYVVFTSGLPNACYYEIHTHALEGMIHVEDHLPNAVLTLGELLDIWGQQLSISGFGTFSGATRWFDTDETGGAPGSHTVTEQTGTDPHMISLIDHHEYTVEVGPSYVNIPNFTWSGYP